MTSKEALEKICLHCEHYHQDMCFRAIAGCEEWHKLEKDLEELEELKKIMGTPIQDIMKRLKLLEILKEHIAFKLDERQRDKYLIKMVSEDTGKYTYIRLYEEEVKKLLKEWLENEKNN